MCVDGSLCDSNCSTHGTDCVVVSIQSHSQIFLWFSVINKATHVYNMAVFIVSVKKDIYVILNTI